MFGLGPAELLVVLVLVLFFYGGKKLPQIGDGLGRGIREFKRALGGHDERPPEPRDPAALQGEATPKAESDRSA